MTIRQQIVQHKDEMDKTINEAIALFSRHTGMRVKSVDIDMAFQNGEMVETCATTKVEL